MLVSLISHTHQIKTTGEKGWSDFQSYLGSDEKREEGGSLHEEDTPQPQSMGYGSTDSGVTGEQRASRGKRKVSGDWTNDGWDEGWQEDKWDHPQGQPLGKSGSTSTADGWEHDGWGAEWDATNHTGWSDVELRTAKVD